MTWWLVGATAWVACGVINSGLVYATFQRRWPILSDDWWRKDAKDAILISVFGPLSLVATAITSLHKHGWLFPGSRP